MSKDTAPNRTAERDHLMIARTRFKRPRRAGLPLSNLPRPEYGPGEVIEATEAEATELQRVKLAGPAGVRFREAAGTLTADGKDFDFEFGRVDGVTVFRRGGSEEWHEVSGTGKIGRKRRAPDRVSEPAPQPETPRATERAAELAAPEAAAEAAAEAPAGKKAKG